MSDGQIDYTRYSSEELQSILLRIDRELVPINYANLLKEIASRPAPVEDERNQQDAASTRDAVGIAVTLLELASAFIPN